MTLPYQHSEHMFRRYEDMIVAIVEKYPHVTILDPPPNGSVETLSCRLRDAMNSLRANKWQTRVDLEQFRDAKIIVSTTVMPGYVSVGSRESLTKIATPGTIVLDTSLSQDSVLTPRINLVDPPLDLVEAILVLHHYRILVEPSIVKLTANKDNPVWPSNQQKLLENNDYDIYIERQDSTFTIT